MSTITDDNERIFELLSRCVDPIADHLNDLENERNTYDVYPEREARFAKFIIDYQQLLSDIRAEIGRLGQLTCGYCLHSVQAHVSNGCKCLPRKATG